MANWGDITGTLSDQTDLQGLLDDQDTLSYSTISAMTSDTSTIADGSIAVVYNNGKRNGIFYYKSSDGSTTADDGIIVSGYATNSTWNRLWDGKNAVVMWWDVKGDGTTDDTTNIQKAFDACKEYGADSLLFNKGTFLISSTGIAITSELVIKGIGIALTTLKIDEGTGDVGLLKTNSNSTPYKVSVTDITFDGNNANNTEEGFKAISIDGDYVSSFEIINSQFINIGTTSSGALYSSYAVYASNIKGLKVANTVFNNFGNPMGSNGVYITGSAASVTIENNQFYYVAHPISIISGGSSEFVHNVTIQSNTIHAAYYHMDFNLSGTGTYANDNQITGSGFPASNGLAGRIVRVMHKRSSAFYNTSTMNVGKFLFRETDKNFSSDGVKQGDIIVLERTSGDDIMGFVTGVNEFTGSKGIVHVEKWLYREGNNKYEPVYASDTTIVPPLVYQWLQHLFSISGGSEQQYEYGHYCTEIL